MNSTVSETDEWEVKIIFKYKRHEPKFLQARGVYNDGLYFVPEIQDFTTTVGETRAISHLNNVLTLGDIAEKLSIFYDCVFLRDVESVAVTAKDEPETIYSRDDLENENLWLRQIWGCKIADGHPLGRADKGETVPTIMVIVNSERIESKLRGRLFAI